MESIDPQSKSYYDINSQTLSLRDYLGFFGFFHSKNVKETNNIDRETWMGLTVLHQLLGVLDLKKRQSREHFVIKQKLFYFKTVP